MMPASSPCAPAAGWSVTRSMPLISASSRSSAWNSASRPCTCSAGESGCAAAKPGRRATRSFSFGLYFIVHEPSG